MAHQADSKTAPASFSARTSRTPFAPPEFVVALAFSPRLTPYTLSLWIGEFFRGSLGCKSFHLLNHINTVPLTPH